MAYTWNDPYGTYSGTTATPAPAPEPEPEPAPEPTTLPGVDYTQEQLDRWNSLDPTKQQAWNDATDAERAFIAAVAEQANTPEPTTLPGVDYTQEQLDRWYSLTPEKQEAWNTATDDERAFIAAVAEQAQAPSEVEQAYQTLFGREGDPSGIEHWESKELTGNELLEAMLAGASTEDLKQFYDNQYNSTYINKDGEFVGVTENGDHRLLLMEDGTKIQDYTLDLQNNLVPGESTMDDIDEWWTGTYRMYQSNPEEFERWAYQNPEWATKWYARAALPRNEIDVNGDGVIDSTDNKLLQEEADKYAYLESQNLGFGEDGRQDGKTIASGYDSGFKDINNESGTGDFWKLGTPSTPGEDWDSPDQLLSNPLTHVVANIIAPGYGEIALQLAEAGYGDSIGIDDLGAVVTSFAPVLGEYVTTNLSNSLVGLNGIQAGAVVAGTGAAMQGGDPIESALMFAGANTITGLMDVSIKSNTEAGTLAGFEAVLDQIMPTDWAKAGAEYLVELGKGVDTTTEFFQEFLNLPNDVDEIAVDFQGNKHRFDTVADLEAATPKGGWASVETVDGFGTALFDQMTSGVNNIVTQSTDTLAGILPGVDATSQEGFGLDIFQNLINKEGYVNENPFYGGSTWNTSPEYLGGEGYVPNNIVSQVLLNSAQYILPDIGSASGGTGEGDKTTVSGETITEPGTSIYTRPDLATPPYFEEGDRPQTELPDTPTDTDTGGEVAPDTPIDGIPPEVPPEIAPEIAPEVPPEVPADWEAILPLLLGGGGAGASVPSRQELTDIDPFKFNERFLYPSRDKILTGAPQRRRRSRLKRPLRNAREQRIIRDALLRR
jgi:hypothetical protein